MALNRCESKENPTLQGVGKMAQRVGFEPTGPVKGLPDFESGPL